MPRRGKAFSPQPVRGPGAPQNTGSQRLLAAAAKGDLHDRALWTPLAAATGAAGNSSALVGTPETVAQALLDYVDIGVTTLLIRGYDPYDDAIDYGRYLIPVVRDEVRRRDELKGGPVTAAVEGRAATEPGDDGLAVVPTAGGPSVQRPVPSFQGLPVILPILLD